MNDALGHPIRKGDKVLTGKHYSPVMDTVLEVVKVTAKYVHVSMTVLYWDKETKRQVRAAKTVRRSPHQVIVIDAQLKYNQEHYPENLL